MRKLDLLEARRARHILQHALIVLDITVVLVQFDLNLPERLVHDLANAWCLVPAGDALRGPRSAA